MSLIYWRDFFHSLLARYASVKGNFPQGRGGRRIGLYFFRAEFRWCPVCYLASVLTMRPFLFISGNCYVGLVVVDSAFW